MFGYFKRKKEDKLLMEAGSIIGKGLLLENYNSDDAHKISLCAMDLLYKNILEIDGQPWVLAVRAMSILRNELIKEKVDDGIDDTLKDLIILSLPNARENANSTDLMILDSIERVCVK